MIKINKESLDQTCGACPSQWDAYTEDNEYVYIRFRHGTLSIEIDENSENKTIFFSYLPDLNLEDFHFEEFDSYSGVLSELDLVDIVNNYCKYSGSEKIVEFV